MRLVNVDTKELEEFQDELLPPYAILSHTWRYEEVTFQDMSAGKGSEKAGYTKTKQCCRQAKAEQLQYVWIDTCCIDKSSSSELSEAVNSMYRWYKQAYCCYVFLDDYPLLGSNFHEQATSHCNHVEDNVPASTDTFCSDCFRQCRWFTRGWTLQELLAPTSLKFYNRSWKQIGYVGSNNPDIPLDTQSRHLGEDIKDATNIPVKYLNRHEQFSSASIAQRFSWASKRQTSRTEDLAYCLLGLFDVSLPILYGEGLKKAFIRLQEEIMKVNDDQSMFAWNLRRLPQGLAWDYSACFKELGFASQGRNRDSLRAGPLLATSPSSFENSWNIIPSKRSTINTGGPHSMTNRGLQIDIHFIENEVMLLDPNHLHWASNGALSYVLLGCVEEDNPYCPLTMCVMCLERNIYARALHAHAIAAVVDWPIYTAKPLRSVYLLQQPQPYTTDVPGKHLTGTTYLFRKLPKRFKRCPKAYPLECWDQKKGTVDVPAWPELAVLEFSLVDSNDERVALFLSCNPPILRCKLIGLRHSVRESLLPGILESGVVLEENGPAHKVYAGNRWYRVCIKEDLVLGGVYTLEVFDIMKFSDTT